MAVVYLIAAASCPAPQVPSAFLLPGTDPAVKASLLTPGGVGAGSLSTPSNLNAAHADNLGAAGGVWAYSIVYGGVLSDGGGLTLNISAVGAGIGAVPTVAAAQTKALTNSSDNYVWLLRDGTISLRQNVITAPATAAAYLGRVTTSGGAITVIDGSGRVEARGGTLFRRTGDAGLPADTPPSEIVLLTQTVGGLYLWDGAQYRQVGLANVANANTIGGVPVLFRIDVADASANTDVVMAQKVRVLDAWALNTGIAADATGDTWQVKNGANAISDAVAKTATVNALKRIGTLNPTYYEIAAGGTLRIAAVKVTNAAVTAYVLAVPVA